MRKAVIVGGGIIGVLESYFLYLKDSPIQIQVYEKGPDFSQHAITNTAYNIFPSLTPDEILSVVPRGQELVKQLACLFHQPGGIRVDDVPGVNNSEAAIAFKKAVELYGSDKNHEDRTQQLLNLGKMSMDLWQELYERADKELKQIFIESNFNPCRQQKHTGQFVMYDGYRIDLIYEVSNAQKHAQEMQKTYLKLGYDQCRIMSPSEVMATDPTLTAFCQKHCIDDASWKSDCCALWRPGGCISTNVFLPKLNKYLKKMMGPTFNFTYNKEVVGIEFDNDSQITALRFADGSIKQDLAHYIFCPGESVGTLHRFGFEEPAYAEFAGPSLILDIPLSIEHRERFHNFSHYMEVHKVGIVLAWQARLIQDRIVIGVAGTKAFYGDQQPTIDDDFAKNRHLVQLNMINEILPEMISLACGWDTRSKQLTAQDISALEHKGMLRRWVGRRSVAYDGFPTLGALYYRGQKVKNARCTTHLGSGGVSFGPAAVHMSRNSEVPRDPFAKVILQYADSRRHSHQFTNLSFGFLS